MRVFVIALVLLGCSNRDELGQIASRFAVPSELALGQVYVGATRLYEFPAESTGPGALRLISTSSSHPDVRILLPEAIALEPYEKATLTLEWEPSDPGELSATVTLVATANQSPEQSVVVHGVALAVPSCDDDNPCTDDTFTNGECQHATNTRPCDDGTACTEDDVCTGGDCIGTSIDCNDGDVCTQDTCDAVLGCAHDPDDVACPPCVARPTGLVAYWPGDGDALDHVGSTHGTLTGGATVVTSGRIAGAFSFDGVASYIQTSDSDAVDFGINDFSVAAWVKTASTDLVVVLDKRREESIVQGYTLFLYDGKPSFQLADAGAGVGHTNYVSSTPVIADGTWHFIAVTVDRDDPQGLRFYVDGAPTLAFNPTGRAGSLDNDIGLRIGSRSFDATGLYAGAIDEVQLYDRALSAGDIATLFDVEAGFCDPAITP